MKKNLLSAAVAAGLAGGTTLAVAQSADPMFVSPDGTGQALVFPYYSAENGNTTSFHIVNTTAYPKMVKVRFREYKASYEVLDFNVYLSKKDHFSFTVAKHPEGITEGAAVITRDNTCTYPALGSDNYSPYEGGKLADGALYQPFVNFEFANYEDSSDQRTLAGYVEVLEMGVPDTSTWGKAWGAAVTHTSKGVPAKCATIADAYEKSTGAGYTNTPNANLGTGVAAPTGGLYGISYHLNVDDAAAFGIEPLVIDDWSASQLHHLAGSELPNLGNGNLGSYVTDPADPGQHTIVWDDAWDAVSSLVMTDRVMNDVMTNSAVGAYTDWVLNFPTKHHYVNGKALATNVESPFADNYLPGNQKAGTAKVKEKLACEYVGTYYYDREEQTIVPEDQPGFSPQPEFEYDYQKICYEVTTLHWDADAGSLNGELGVQKASFIFEDGWAEIYMDRNAYEAAASSAVAGRCYMSGTEGGGSTANRRLEGLPVFGFMATKYSNGTVMGDTMFQYGHVADHKTRTVLSD